MRDLQVLEPVSPDAEQTREGQIHFGVLPVFFVLLYLTIFVAARPQRLSVIL